MFNFYRLSDTQFDEISGGFLSPDNLLGNEDVVISLNLKQIVNAKNKTSFTDYAIGGRMYIEFSLFAITQAFADMPYFSMFIDLQNEGQGSFVDIRTTPGMSALIAICVIL